MSLTPTHSKTFNVTVAVVVQVLADDEDAAMRQVQEAFRSRSIVDWVWEMDGVEFVEEAS